MRACFSLAARHLSVVGAEAAAASEGDLDFQSTSDANLAQSQEEVEEEGKADLQACEEARTLVDDGRDVVVADRRKVGEEQAQELGLGSMAALDGSHVRYWVASSRNQVVAA
jgi:hypothetical protein